MLGWKGAEAEDTPCKNIGPNTGLASGESLSWNLKRQLFSCVPKALKTNVCALDIVISLTGK